MTEPQVAELPRERVWIYARISQDRQGHEVGISNQKKACYAYARRRDLDVVGEQIDNSVSAYDRRPRPGFERAKAALRAGEIDGLLVWHPDRLYRRTADLHELIAIAEHQPFTVYQVEGDDLDLRSPLGKMLASLISSVAEYEADQKATRQALANKARAARGGWHGGPVPFGYKLKIGGGGIEVDPVAEAALQEVLRRLRAGNSLLSITKWLRTQGPIDSAGLPEWRRMKPQSLKALLTSPTIAGLRSYIPQRDRAQHQVKQQRGERPPGSKLSGVLTPAAWAPIFTEGEWSEISALLDKPDHPNRGRVATKSLLAGMIFCDCGAPMGYSSQSYKCSAMTYRPDRSPGCGAVSINSRAVEGEIEFAFLNGLLPPAMPLPPVPATSNPEIDVLLTRLEMLNQTLTDPSAPYKDNLDKFFEDRRRIENAIRERQDHAVRVARNAVTRQQRTLTRESWPAATLDERRAFLAAIPLRVEIGPAEYGKHSGPKFDPRRVLISLGEISPPEDVEWFTGGPPEKPWKGWPKPRPPKPKSHKRA